MMKRGSISSSTMVWVAWLFLLVSGCATIGEGEPVTTERLVRTTKETRASSAFTADVQQDRTVIDVTAWKLCEVVTKPVMERTTTTDNVNKTPGTDYAYGGLGAALAVTGGVVLVDASNVHPNDDTSRTYNAVGPGAAKAIGWSTLTVGGAMLLVPVIDGLRTIGSREEVQQVTTGGEVIESNVACPGRPLANTKVFIALGDAEFDCGETDKHGSKQFDLDEVIPPETVMPSSTAKATVVISGKSVGEVSIKALYEGREAKEWSKISVQECKTPTAADSCRGLIAYARKWPDGKHATMAREILLAARPTLLRLADEKAWGDADPEGCTKADYETTDGVNRACQGVRDYLKDRADGIHAGDATRLIDKADKRIAAITARQEREQQAAERKRKADEEAERRRVEQEERREAEKEKRRCKAECDLGCSGWQFRHNPGACRSSCYEVRCSE